MPITFRCEKCGKEHQVDDGLAGAEAACRCGHRLKIPSPQETAALEDAVDQLVPVRIPMRRAIEKALVDFEASWVQVLLAIAVGTAIGVSGQAKSHQEPTTAELTLGAVGGAICGAIAGALLIVADWVKKKKLAGHRIPLLLNIYFGKGWLSAMVWILTAFFASILFVLYLDITTPP